MSRVQGRRIRKTVTLTDGDHIRIGSYEFTFAINSAGEWLTGGGGQRRKTLHPVRHYAADVLHPFWTVTHPIRAAMPERLNRYRPVSALTETGQIAVTAPVLGRAAAPLPG